MKNGNKNSENLLSATTFYENRKIFIYDQEENIERKSSFRSSYLCFSRDFLKYIRSSIINLDDTV